MTVDVRGVHQEFLSLRVMIRHAEVACFSATRTAFIMPWCARLMPQLLQACPHGLTAQMNRADSGLVMVVCVSLYEGADVHTIVPCL